MAGFDRPGIPRASELKELVPAAIAGNREAFIRALKVGLYLHARQELGLTQREALEMLGTVDWTAITYKVEFVNGASKEAAAHG